MNRAARERAVLNTILQKDQMLMEMMNYLYDGPHHINDEDFEVLLDYWDIENPNKRKKKGIE